MNKVILAWNPAARLFFPPQVTGSPLRGDEARIRERLSLFSLNQTLPLSRLPPLPETDTSQHPSSRRFLPLGTRLAPDP